MAYKLRDQHGNFLRVFKYYGEPFVQKATGIGSSLPTVFKDSMEALNAVKLVDEVNSGIQLEMDKRAKSKNPMSGEMLEFIEVTLVPVNN